MLLPASEPDLVEAILMRGHNICFRLEIRKIVFKLSSIPSLIWSSVFYNKLLCTFLTNNKSIIILLLALPHLISRRLFSSFSFTLFELFCRIYTFTVKAIATCSVIHSSGGSRQWYRWQVPLQVKFGTRRLALKLNYCCPRFLSNVQKEKRYKIVDITDDWIQQTLTLSWSNQEFSQERYAYTMYVNEFYITSNSISVISWQ